MTWDAGEPTMGDVFTPKLEALLGPRRKLDEPLSSRHEAIAASVQVVFEEAALHVLNDLQRRTANTGVPLVLNTSFNENEPIVHTPDQALDCFLRTDMDVLVMGSHTLQKIVLD